MSMIAIITARGGSKRIPQKNIRMFCGKPIIAYSIEAAISSGIFDEVMVSTDSEEIASISKNYKASVPFLRSEATSNDYATTADVIREVLTGYKGIGKEYEYFACIYPTAPFLTGEKLVEAAELLNGSDTVLSVVKYSFPPQRAFVIRDEQVKYVHPEHEKTRTQDLEPMYHDCGQFYFCNTKMFLQYNSLILPRTRAYIVREEEMQDIDTLSDWRVAEAKYNLICPG